MSKPLNLLVAAALSSISSILVIGAEASAQSYTRSSTSRGFSSIQLTGSPVSLTSSDEGYGSFSAPFSFDLFGTPVASFSTLYVGSNGTLHLDSSVAPYTNAGIPSSGAPNGFVAPFWDDLYLVSPTGGVYYQTIGTTGSRVLVIEWTSAGHYDSTSDTFSFQLLIYEGTNQIEFHYGPRSIIGVWSGTIGIEDGTGFDGVTELCSPSCAPSSVSEGTVITLTPSGSPPAQADLTVSYVQTPPSTIQEGTFISLDYEIYNAGLGSSGSGEIALYAGVSPTVTTSDYEIARSSFSGIASGSYGSGTFSGTIPTGLAGTWYVGAIVDPSSVVPETSETNNGYSLGSVTITPASSGGITITTTSLPSAQIGSSYSAQLQQSGASAPYWSILSGALPSGLTMSTGGLISGAPGSEGIFSFAVRAEESGLTPGTAELSINVGAGGSIQITTTSLPNAEVGVPYEGTVTAIGGAPPYAFQIISGRPDWLILDSSGTFSGTPTEVGAHQLTISVFDSAFADASAILTLEVVQPQALSIATEMPAGVTGREYAQRIVQGGVPPYTVTITDGALPPGLSIDGAGQLAGLPTSAGSFSFTIGASDSNAPQGYAQAQLTVEVIELTALEVAIGRELLVYVNTDVDQELSARGGVPPYSWSIAVGQLIPGLSLNPDGHLVGRVSQVGTSSVTFVVTDSEGATAESEVLVRATVFRAPGSRGGTDGRRGGCGCSAHSPVAGSAWSLLALVGLLLVGRVQRRRGPTRPATPNQDRLHDRPSL